MLSRLSTSSITTGRSMASMSCIRSMSSTTRLLAGSEGATAASKEFGDRERAQETAYVKKKEAEQLKVLKEQLAKQKETIDKLADEIKSMKK